MLFWISVLWELEEAGVWPVSSFVLVATHYTAVISTPFLLRACHDSALCSPWRGVDLTFKNVLIVQRCDSRCFSQCFSEAAVGGVNVDRQVP